MHDSGEIRWRGRNMGVEIFSLNGKVAVVTGAGRGIGRTIALGLAEAGADVVVAARTQAEIEKTAEAIRGMGRRSLAVPTDTTDLESVRNLASRSLEEFGKIDILVNNAGRGGTVPFLKLSVEDWDNMLAINLKGYFLCTQVIGGYMFKARSGRVINVSSIMGSCPMPFMAHYAASKGAIDAMTKSLAQEWASRGITVNAIAPSYFLTEITRSAYEDEATNRLISSKTPLGRWGELHELVGLVVYLASDASSYMTGAVIPLDGGWSAG
jgi:NAD(P)-dependent dehydrogenase (short-subunit alcohol dehydrogenase family)